MAKRFSRLEIIERLKGQIKLGKIIFMFGAGIGLSAKCAEIGGSDLIGIFSTAFWRMHGVSSLMAWLPYSNANTELINSAKYILPEIKRTPCIAGIGAQDPTRNIEQFIDEIINMGFSGVCNEPFVEMYGKPFASILEDVGLGFSREAEMISLANKKDIFSVVWVFNPEQAIIMAKSGADIIGVMLGLTVGGINGAKKSISLKKSLQKIEDIYQAAKSYNKDIMIITHGGPLKDVKTAEYSIRNTKAVGYAAGSSGERIYTERAIIEITKKYKNIKLLDF